MTAGGMDDFRAQLPILAHGVMLVLARVGGVTMLLPGLGEAETPMTVRAGWALALTLVLFPIVAPLMPAMPAGPAPLAAEFIAEIITGLWLGWLARLAVMAMPMAGGVISYMTGLSSVLHPNTEGGGRRTRRCRSSLILPCRLSSSQQGCTPFRCAR